MRVQFLCVFIGALLLVACGGDPAAGDASALSKKSSKKSWRLAVVPKGNSHEFWQAVRRGAEAADAEFDDITVEYKGPATENDLTQQKELLELHLTRGLDAIGVAPVDGTAMAPIIDTAAAQAVPLVVFDSGTAAKNFGSFIATDNEAAGRKAGEEMLRRLGDAGGKIVVLRYKIGSISTEKREKGFLDVVKAADNIEILSADQEGAGKEKEVSQNLLVKFGAQADGIYTPNESTTTGMMLALRESGGYTGKLVHIGFDSTSEIVSSIQNKEIAAVVVQNPVRMGYLTVVTLRALLSGTAVEKVIDTGSELVTTDTLANPEIRALVGLKP